MSSTKSARQAGLAIWDAGVDEVRAEHLINGQVTATETELVLANHRLSLDGVRRICVVGAGKAAGYLALALEAKLAPLSPRREITGWINVPENCVEPTTYITLHGARPAGMNEPRAEGVAGAEKIRRMVASLESDDICICLLTGGGSALLPAPAPGISLDEKLVVTRFLSGAGAHIQDLNRVRSAISMLKGGGLARACRAGKMVTLIISDILGDPLDLIASGPTVDATADPREALEVLRTYDPRREAVPQSVWSCLESRAKDQSRVVAKPTCRVENLVLANNETAVAAAAREARRQRYEVEIVPPEPPHTTAEEVGRRLLEKLGDATGARRCILWGGEPVVQLTDASRRGRGGRNQQLVLAALDAWRRSRGNDFPEPCCLLSGGTDGEDGPTDAAGAILDASVLRRARTLELDPAEFLARNDAYAFFEQTGGLIVTGPTHTNVCDLRVAVVE